MLGSVCFGHVGLPLHVAFIASQLFHLEMEWIKVLALERGQQLGLQELCPSSSLPLRSPVLATGPASLFPFISYSGSGGHLILPPDLDWVRVSWWQFGVPCHPLPGDSPSPAALSAAEDLIFYAIRKGHLSPRYIQPLLLEEEVCPAHEQPVPRKGKVLSPRSPSSQWHSTIRDSFLGREHLTLRSRKFWEGTFLISPSHWNGIAMESFLT